MSKYQKIIAAVFAALLGLMVLFPPYQMSPAPGTDTTTSLGYHFVLMGPNIEADPARRANVHVERLLIQMGVLVGLFVAGMVLFRNRSDEADEAPEKIGSTDTISNARHRG